MGNVQAEFHCDEVEMMWEIYAYLVEKFGPRALKPPIKSTNGKWHFYISTPDHKRKTKERRF